MTAYLRLGTRGSPLAMVQALMVAGALREAQGWEDDRIEIVPIRTTGDRVQDRPLAELGGKGLFTKELDAALLAGRIDIAVHSMKDVETVLAPGLDIAATLPRADVRDRLLTPGRVAFEDLPHGARIGTSSPRRAAQARHARPDLRIIPFRGNVDTRIRRLEAGEAEATFLAAAGLDRLGSPEVGLPLPEERFLPAPAQGAVGIGLRVDDERTRALVAAANHRPTFDEIAAERAVLARLGGSCRTPVAVRARVNAEEVDLRAEILLPDGSERRAGMRRCMRGDIDAAAAELAAELKGRASAALRALFGG